MPHAPTPLSDVAAPHGAEPGASAGAIQPHGLLLVLHPASLDVLQVAGDAALLGAAAPPRPGQPLAALVPPGPRAQIAQLLAQPPETELHAAEIALPGGARLDVSVQHGEAGVLLEIQPLAEAPAGAAGGPLAAVAAMAARLEGVVGSVALCRAATEELRRFTGFGVALHRVGADGAAIPVAEAPPRGSDAPACQHGALPRGGDLPGWSRLVPDAARDPAPLEPALSPLTGAPTDLAASRLRSVPEAELQALRGAGVRAAMSLSVLRDGRLWGVFACHDLAPRSLSFAMRAASELFAQLFSLQLEAASQAEDAADAARLGAAARQLLDPLAAAPDLVEGLRAHLAALRAFLPGSGAAVLAGGQVIVGGAVPQAEILQGLRDALAGGAGVVALDSLGDGWPAARGRGPDAGVLRLALPGGVTILWFRAGPLPGGAARRWAPIEVEAAESLRIALLEGVLHRMEEVAQDRARARQRQDLRLNELDHRVKSMLANLQGLARHGGLGAPGLETLLASLHARLRGLEQAHGLPARARWEGLSLRGLAEDHLRPQGAAGNGRATVEGAELRLRPRAALALGAALHELATNAAKHGALSLPQGRVRLAWQVEDGRLLLDWVEEGGPPVAAPARLGFGGLVVERGLAAEFGGKSRLLFRPAGLRWQADLPLAAVGEVGAAPARPAGLAGARVMVVEDSVFVAMAMADGLEAAGAEVIGPLGTLAEAEAAIAAGLPDAALLDIDLDGVPVFPVADRLTERGVPIVFTTGYEPRLVLPPRYARAAVLPKPCRGDEAAAAVRLALAER